MQPETKVVAAPPGRQYANASGKVVVPRVSLSGKGRRRQMLTSVQYRPAARSPFLGHDMAWTKAGGGRTRGWAGERSIGRKITEIEKTCALIRAE